MVLIKSATRGLCFLLGLLTGVPSHLAIPPAGDGMNSTDATEAYAGTTFIAFGGGRQIWFASVLRFCTIAARWNSSRAPERPRNRIRSKRWWVFRWANRISTLLRSSRDLANSGLPINARATSRASSCTSRGIFRKVIFGVHLALMWHEPQSRVLAR